MLLIFGIIQNVIIAQPSLTFLRQSKVDLLQYFGKPSIDTKEEVMRGIKISKWIYNNMPDKEAETAFYFDMKGEVVKIIIYWPGNAKKCLSLWNKYIKRYKKDYQLISETPETDAKFLYKRRTNYFEVKGELGITLTDIDLIVRLDEL